MAADLRQELAELEELERLEARAKKTSALPEWLSDALKYGPGFLKESGKSLLRGALDLGAKAPEVAGSVLFGGTNPAAARDLENLTKRSEKAVSQTLPKRENLTESEKLWDNTAEAAGAAVLGSPGTPPVRTAMAGGTGFLGGHFGGNLAEKTGFPRIAGELPGGLLTGGAAGWFLGPKLHAVDDDLSRASRGLTNEQVAAALEKQKQFDAAGAKTATITDTLPIGSPLRALADKVRNSELGNPLQVKTVGRADEVERFGKEYLERLGPEVEPATIASQLSGAADDALLTTKKLRSDAIANRMAAAKTPQEAEIFKLYQELFTRASNPKLPESVAKPYAEVAKQLFNQDGSFITSPQQLSFQLRELKKRDANPSQMQGGAQQIGPGYLREAINFADSRLRQIIPEYGQALDDFAAFSKPTTLGQPNWMTLGDIEKSPIGRMSSNNPNLNETTPVSKLGMLTAPEYSPNTVQQIAGVLSNPVMTGGRTVDPSMVLRAQGQMQLKNDKTSVGKIVGGPLEENIAAVLSSQGRQADDILAPARTAKDLSQQFMGTPGMSEIARMQPIQAMIRLLRTADMTVTRAQQLKYAEEMGRILSQPGGKEIFSKLQELAQFDPTVRKNLSTLVPLLGVANGEGASK